MLAPANMTILFWRSPLQCGARMAAACRLGGISKRFAAGPDAGGFAADTLVRPVAIAAVQAGHVFGHRGRPMRPQAAPMAGDALAAVEDLDRRRGDPRLDLLADQLVRHAVEMLGNLDVVVEVDPAALPLGVFV